MEVRDSLAVRAMRCVSCLAGHYVLNSLLILMWLFVLPLPALFVAMLSGRQLLIIAPCTFEVRRTIGRPLRSSTDAPPTCHLWKPSRIDRMLRRQVTGKTRDLTKAEVRTMPLPTIETDMSCGAGEGIDMLCLHGFNVSLS